MNPSNGDDFARQVTECQQRLFGYIHSLLGNHAASWDVLQESNLVLWRKRDEFQPGSNFPAWATTVARFQVLAYLRDKGRSILTALTPELVALMADEAAEQDRCFDERRTALRACVSRLETRDRMLLRLYYEENRPLREIAERIEAQANAVKQMLFRIRSRLRICIESNPPS